MKSGTPSSNLTYSDKDTEAQGSSSGLGDTAGGHSLGGNQLSASWYTPALPFGEVKLLNGWSVSEFSKLVQLDSGLLGDAVSSRTDICMQASQ